METIAVKKWSEFRDIVDGWRQVLPTYWRGQADSSWPLASRFEREILSMAGGNLPGAPQTYPYGGRYVRDGNRIWGPAFYRNVRDRYLQKFKNAASGLRGQNPAALDEAGWWALGRHYGLVTPLLDWTESPYIAAFFALSDLWGQVSVPGGGQVFEGKTAAVFRLLHADSLEDKAGRTDGLRIVRPLVEELARMHGQRGLFTWLKSEDFFELEGYLTAQKREGLVTKIIISDQAIFDGLRDLQAHGIDYRLLFPDMLGAAMYANAAFDRPK